MPPPGEQPGQLLLAGHRHERKRKRGGRALFGSLVLLAVVLLGWWSPQAIVHNPLAQSLPAAGAPVAPPATVPAEHTAAAITDTTSAGNEPPAPMEIPRAAMPVEAAGAADGFPPLHITYPAVEMDQAVLPLAPTELEKEMGAIVPPHTPDAYWLTPYGSVGAGSANTTYIVGHSWEGRLSPFNNISTRSKQGDELTVTTGGGSLVYRIDQISTEYKDTLRDSSIWDIVPGRLILITCFTEDLWGKNIVIQASPVASK
jgi:hypothetical protein